MTSYPSNAILFKIREFILYSFNKSIKNILNIKSHRNEKIQPGNNHYCLTQKIHESKESDDLILSQLFII